MPLSGSPSQVLEAQRRPQGSSTNQRPGQVHGLGNQMPGSRCEEMLSNASAEDIELAAFGLWTRQSVDFSIAYQLKLRIFSKENLSSTQPYV